jgi:hypothetical protein
MAETKSGLREVHVQLFPRIGEARAGLIDGSDQPRRRSGQATVPSRPDRKLMIVPVKADAILEWTGGPMSDNVHWCTWSGRRTDSARADC